MRTSQSRPGALSPARSMLRTSLVFSSVTLPVIVLVSWLVRGGTGALSALVGALVAVGFFTWYFPTIRSLFLSWQRVVNGFELVREIKSRGTSTPVMLMSAVYNDRDQSSRTVQLGTLADGYLSKPFDLVHLLSQVRQLLGEAK